MKEKKACVIGVGTMGHQIALVFASAGVHTAVYDADPVRLDAGVTSVEALLSKRVSKEKISREQAEKTRDSIHPVSDFELAVSDSDFIVEAVFENIDVKREVFSKLGEICSENTIFATNTSTLSVTEIATAAKISGRCVGTHFLIPAALTPLVEVVRGLQTSDETHRRTVEFMENCGKQTVTVNDMPGFAINRLYIPLLNEAFFALAEGVATAEQIDKSCKMGLGHPLGPLAASDASGLDVVLSCVESLHRQLGDKYRPAPLLVKLVQANRLGRKTGCGVYDYRK